MPTSMWNKQTFSVATDELSALTGEDFATVMGTLVIDLVSAPITPGTYDIRLTAIMGGIQIFLPAYVKVQLNGETFWGGKRIYHGEEYPVTLRFTINTTMGRAHIYQLEPNSVESNHASQPDN